MLYLDNNSTTPLAPEVTHAMEQCWREEFGNPSSMHRVGQAARHAVETAREQVAALLGADSREIVFTSGGTEADNLAILGTFAANLVKRHVVTTAVEHPAVYETCKRLQTQGYRATFVGVDSSGALDLDAFTAALDADTGLASVMYVNNETGVIFPIREVAEICAAKGVPLHVDAVQAAGKIEIDVKHLGVSLLSISAHKFHGPKGTGALYVGRGARLRNLFVGGHQEHEIRPGTQNVAGIVGLGAAAELARRRLAEGLGGVAALRDRLESGILERVRIAGVIGDRNHRAVNTAEIGFESLQADAILLALSEEGLCASAGAACSSGSLEPSHVLTAMGIDSRLAHGAIRFSLSYETTGEDVDRALEIVPRVIERLASLTPVK